MLPIAGLNIGLCNWFTKNEIVKNVGIKYVAKDHKNYFPR